MNIEKLLLHNFRNYNEIEFIFSREINILVGDNAQGKTNCAEAIFYLCTGYSPRATKEKQVISYGKDEAEITGKAKTRYGDVEVKIQFKDKKKDIYINSVPIKKIGELMGNINSVFFNPSDLKLIKESPDDRRRFINISLCQSNRQYFYSLSKYNNILEQRNTLLKNDDRTVINDTLPFWDVELEKEGKYILSERMEFVKKLTPICKLIHNYLTSGKEEIDIELESTSIENGEIVFMDKLKKSLEKDIILGYTTVGPQRDDLAIKINGEDVKTYGSQGQQRTCALSLKLAEMELFFETFGEYPVLILDDALSELDASRRVRLLDYVKKYQTIITCTDLGLYSLEGIGKVFKIKSGEIIQ